jgi:hypothetical protein
VRQTLVRLARFTGLALSELLTWEPRDIATLVDDIDEETAAAKRASRR